VQTGPFKRQPADGHLSGCRRWPAAFAGAVPRRGGVTSCGYHFTVVCMAPPSDEVFPSIHFLGELGALLGRHGYTPAHVPVAHAVGQAIPELVAFLSAYRAARRSAAPTAASG
jgi:hypothetical protein